MDEMLQAPLVGLKETCVRQDRERRCYCTSLGSASRAGERWLAPGQMWKEAWMGFADRL